MNKQKFWEISWWQNVLMFFEIFEKFGSFLDLQFLLLSARSMEFWWFIILLANQLRFNKFLFNSNDTCVVIEVKSVVNILIQIYFRFSSESQKYIQKFLGIIRSKSFLNWHHQNKNLDSNFSNFRNLIYTTEKFVEK